ncbi:hypothetical protein GQ600_12011 [Phytophthora cactorum]|nr:hypothetical protein GQ600_12011 [Phytophthora cactorum]
MLPVTVC